MDGSLLTHTAEDTEAPRGGRLAIVCMPFASSDRPSIQLGLIGAIARRAGYETDLLHFNLNLARQLGPELYERLAPLLEGECVQRTARAAGEAGPIREDARALPVVLDGARLEIWIDALRHGRRLVSIRE